MRLHSYDAVLFDLDGVLVATTALHAACWKATFDPGTTDSIAPGTSATITATITPASDAIAGDYALTFTARGTEANDQVDIRFTVATSAIGAIIGAILLIAAVGGLWWVFRRYGRR